MKFSWRAVLCAVVMIGATGAFKSCKTGPSSGGEDPPKTADDRFVVTATGVTSLAVLSNDTNLTHEPLKYTIDESPTVGSASFNTDNTVALSLPSGFRGVTKFKYKVTNSVGGFSISSAVVFVDVPAYRALFAAKDSAGAYELYTSDLISPKKISNATSGNFRLKNYWRSKSGLLIAYERGDASATELYYVKPNDNASPAKLVPALSRAFVSGDPVTIADDNRWLAYTTNPTSGSGKNLYIFDTNSSSSPIVVGSSTGVLTAFTQWAGGAPTLYYVAPQGANGYALLRVSPGATDTPQRVSPVYASADQQQQVLVSPDEERALVIGTHSGVKGAFLIDLTNPGVERRLTTDMPANAVIEAVRTDEQVTRLTYLWRVTGSATATVSVVNIDSNSTPQSVFEGNVVGLSDLRLDGLAALITRGSNGAGSDGTLYEVMLDGSTNPVQVTGTATVTGGIYDGTGDRVYLFSRTLTPSILQRSDFERTPTALVRTSTPAGALFVSPTFEPSAAILEDPTSGVVLVNAAAPGKTLKLTDLSIGSLPTGAALYPTIVAGAP